MKKATTKAVLAAIALSFFALAAMPLQALAAAQIGVADYKAVLENCNAYGDMLTRLNAEMETAKVNLGKQLMTETNPVRKRQLTIQFEDNYARRRSELAQPLFEKVKAAVVQVAQEYGLSRVEDTATGARGVDITNAVIAYLNSQTPAPRQGYAQPQPQPPQYGQPAPQQQYAQTQQQPAETDPFAEEDSKLSKKARKAQAKAAKAARKAEKLAARAKAAEEQAQMLSQGSGAAQPAQEQYAQAPAQPEYTQPTQTSYDSLGAVSAPRQPARRSYTSSSQPSRRRVGPAIAVPSLESSISEEPQEAAPAPKKKSARKAASKPKYRARRSSRTGDYSCYSSGPAQYRSSSKSSLEVQFGADYDKPDITGMVNYALKNGIKGAYVLETTSQRTGKLYWRARVPASDKAQARELSRRLSAIGFDNYITDGR